MSALTSTTELESASVLCDRPTNIVPTPLLVYVN